MRKVLVATGVGAVALIGSMAPAGAHHTGGGCPHGVTLHAHQTVPQDNHTAHDNIPYCPPHDAPRHKEDGGGHASRSR